MAFWLARTLMKQKYLHPLRNGILILSLLLLVCLILYYPHYKAKTELHRALSDISRLQPGQYTITIGVYGSETTNLDIYDSDIQEQIVQRLSYLNYDGVEHFPPPITAEDHVYWITFFSNEPFIAITLEIGGANSRNCMLGNNHRIRIANADNLYSFLTEIAPIV